MEKEKKNQRATETDFVLQWGSKKRHRCLKLKKEENLANKSKPTDAFTRKKLTSRFVTADKDFPSRLPKKSSILSPEKEDRYYTTRELRGLDDGSKALVDNNKENKKRIVWPKLVLSLSNKEKEEDFMAMKGCKPPQRPKKRAKLVQKTLLMVSPGLWLSDLCQERYEVREKKSSKKVLPCSYFSSMFSHRFLSTKQTQRPRGLKAMGSIQSDSE